MSVWQTEGNQGLHGEPNPAKGELHLALKKVLNLYLAQYVTVPAIVFWSIDLVLLLLHRLEVLHEFCCLLKFFLLL